MGRPETGSARPTARGAAAVAVLATALHVPSRPLGMSEEAGTRAKTVVLARVATGLAAPTIAATSGTTSAAGGEEARCRVAPGLTQVLTPGVGRPGRRVGPVGPAVGAPGVLRWPIGRATAEAMAQEVVGRRPSTRHAVVVTPP